MGSKAFQLTIIFGLLLMNIAVKLADNRLNVSLPASSSQPDVSLAKVRSY